MTVNTVGEQVTNYVLQSFTKARVLIHRADTTNDNGDVYAPASRTIEIRHYHNVTEYHLIKIDGKMHRVLSVENDNVTHCKRLTIIQQNE